MQTLPGAPQNWHAPFVGASAGGDFELQKLLEECNAPDNLKHLSPGSQRHMRIALRVVWPTFKQLNCSRQRCSGTSGGQRESSIFECRLVDVRGDSCLFRIYVGGDPASKVAKDRRAELAKRFFDGSAWIFSELWCYTVLKTPDASGCSVRAVLSWGSHAEEPPLKFTPILQLSRLNWALPRVPLPAGELGDLAGLRESCLVDLCMMLVAAGEVKERAGAAVVDATFVDKTGCCVSLSLWREDAKLAAANVGKIFYTTS